VIDRTRIAICVGCAILSLILGLVAGYMIRDSMEVPEDVSPAPAVRQDDGSLIAERRHDPDPPPAPHQIPAGSTEERRIVATIRPAHPDPVTGRCPELKLTTSLIRDGRGRRAVLGALNGDIISGLDTPIVPGTVAAEPKWALGPSYGLIDGSWGLRVDYDWTPRIRLSLDAYLDRDRFGEAKPAARVSAMWRLDL
jgi:hypothetical protein